MTTTTATAPELTDRDTQALAWVGEMGGARTDVLAVLLARLSPNPDAIKGGALAPASVRHHRKRWEALGLVERARIGHGEPAWVWLSRRGVAHIDTEGLAYREPRVSTRDHTHALACARLWFEQSQPGGTWTPERLLAKRVGERPAGSHLPDAEVVTADGRRVAVEVERTQKARSRWRTTWGLLLTGTLDQEAYEAAWYLAPAALLGPLRTALDEVPDHISSRVEVYDLAHCTTPVVAS